MMEKVMVAKQEHLCTYGNDPILPGERYIDEVIPPWQIIVDDVDDDGRPIGSPNGEWTHNRFHATCRNRIEFGDI